MNNIKPLTEGRMSKGGQNPPNTSDASPPAPGPNGNQASENVCKANDAVLDWASRTTDMNKLTVFPPGTRIELGIGEDRVRADVTGIAIYDHGIEYRVVWWNGRARCQEWVQECEVRPLPGEAKLPVGFSTGQY